MAWIQTIDPAQATGLLKRIYDAAAQRAGRVFNIIRLQSQRPRVLQASTQLYVEVMRSPESGLSRTQREMIAVAVSRANNCHYWTKAHAADLRAEVHEQPGSEALVLSVMTDYQKAALLPADKEMLRFAVKLTMTPGQMTLDDVSALRAQGFGDAAIHDIVQVAALFNYYNRLAEGLGIDPEPWSEIPVVVETEAGGTS